MRKSIKIQDVDPKNILNKQEAKTIKGGADIIIEDTMVD